MSVPWYDQVNSSFNNLARNGLKSFLASNSREADSEDKSVAAPNAAPSVSIPRANVFPESSDRAQMPANPPPYLTKTIPKFLSSYSNSAPHLKRRVQIDLESDDESEPGIQRANYTGRGARDPHETGDAPTGPTQQSNLRNGPRLDGGLIRRDPDEDATNMHKRRGPFKTHSVFKPIDRLGALPGTRSEYIQGRTNNRRVPFNPPSAVPTKTTVHSNDHITPNKKLKTDDLREAGDSSVSAISLDDTQIPNDSEDELALSNYKPSSQVHNGQARQTLSSRELRESPTSVLRSRNAVHTSQIRRRDRDFSPIDEGDFTKVAARERKGEKDKLLESSPAAPSLSARQRTSPSLGQRFRPGHEGSHAPEQDRRKKPTPDSPDAIQGGETRPKRRTSPINAKVNELRTRSGLHDWSTRRDSSATTAKSSNSREKQTASPKTLFKLREFLYDDLVDAPIYTIEIDTSTKEISLHTDSPIFPDEPLICPRAIRQIAGIFYGANGSALVRLQFSAVGQEYMFLRFDSDKSAYDFVTLLQQTVPAVRATGKDADWMECALDKFQATRRNSHGRARMKINQAENKPPGSMQHFPSAQPTPAEKRTRLIDKLDAPSPASRQHTIISGADRKAVSEDTGPAQKHARQHAAHESASPETSHATISTRRVTRSQVELERSQGRSQSETPSRALGPQWSRDLVYPHAGRRAAIVHFDDLARLDHDGFLNDNLILFFMRYLETHMEKNNPEVYKRMHFFNSYFYEALTKAPKAKKSLNYEAVSRWTKNINLFSRDFVVVPVNENLHWYVAIICNLPYFLGDKGDSGWPERTLGVDHADERDEDEGEEEADAQTALTQNSLAELSISDGEKDGRNAAKKKGPGRRRTARRSLPKYPVNKPVIITLDSLGHSRSATCSHLRNYVALEAKDKRNLDINPAELRGMTAKEIPTQSNFSDCGLFVCVYLEQFVADPYNFVRRILQRDGSEQQWPRRIHSEDLRSRLRELILEMHRRQEKESTKQDEPIIGNILIDKRTPSPTPPPVHEKQPTKQDIKEAQEKFEELMGARGERYDSHEDPTVEQNPPAAANETTDVIHTVPDSQEYYDDDDGRDIIINDEVSKVRTERPPKSRLGCEPQLKQTLPSASTARARASPLLTHTRPSPKDRTHSNPVELAERLREGRTEQPLRKRRRVTQLEKSPEKMRASRSPSRLTDELLSGEKAWLPGIESFAAHVSAGPVPATTGHENARRTMRENMSPSPSPSSEPEIVGERKVLSGKQISGLRKRKRPAGKLQAPETAEDLARGELNGFYDNADAGVPESLEARLKHRSSS